MTDDPGEMKIPRVLLAEDHAMVAAGVRRILEPDFEIVGVAADGRALLEAARRLEPDLVLLDVGLPLLNGVDAARRLREITPARIVMLTAQGDPAVVREAFAAGARGYLLKTSEPEELTFALRQVLRGHRYVTPAIAGDLVDAAGARPAGGAGVFERLTARQREVLQLAAEGKSLKEIASALGLSVKTVEYHKTRLRKELGLQTSADLARYATEHGLTPPEPGNGMPIAGGAVPPSAPPEEGS